MAKKGSQKKQKRLAAPREIKLLRKESKFTIAYKPGAHKKGKSVAIGILIRDILGITKNSKETKYILTKGKILVNMKVKKDYSLPVGLFDIISIPSIGKNYKVVFDAKGRFTAVEEKNSKEKLCKIIGKKIIKGKKLVVVTNDGRQIEDKANKINVGDSVIIGIPEGKLTSHYPLSKGSTAYIISGKHAGEQAKIMEVREGSMTKPKLVRLEGKEKKFETLAENIMILNEK